MIEGICQRYHVLPSQAREEDVSVLYHLALLAEGGALGASHGS